ncbi:MAG: insulinase family protein [Candidatus Kapabacteria bacterium]|nr:insulinase family protein [Candidatus Kapabacteria bacterium]
MKAFSSATALFPFLAFLLFAQPSPIPQDPALRSGKLSNGLRYFLLPHKMPAQRLWIMLSVGAGSMEEDDDQRGLAHFVEHMGFNGTRHFPKQQLIETLESFGMRFGADLNAFTGYESTNYILQVPSDRPDALDTALLILLDWATGIQLDSLEFEKERPVIIEEWRLGKGAEDRMWQKQAPIVYQGTRYADRDPIGDTAVLLRAPLEAALRYYRTWYRPDLIDIIAVGDAEMEQVERKIRQLFDTIASSSIRPRQRELLPILAQPIVAVAADPEAMLTQVQFTLRLPYTPPRTLDDWRQNLIERLLAEIIDAELEERIKQPNPPCRFISTSLRKSTGGRRELSFSALLVVPGGIESALCMVGTEIERARQHRFTQSQLDQARQKLLREYERQWTNRNKEESENLLFELWRKIEADEVPTSPEFRYKSAQAILPTVTLEELEQTKAQLLRREGTVVIVSSEENKDVPPPTEDRIRALLDSIASVAHPPYQEVAVPQTLLESPPKPGTIRSEKTLPRSGIRLWTLSNGIRVVLKPTTNSDDEFHIRLFRSGGHSLASDADFPSAYFAAEIAAECGVGRFSLVEIERFLKGKIVKVSPFIRELLEGIEGSASWKDAKTLFELLYLHVTAPRFDSSCFASFLAKNTAYYENLSRLPDLRFYDTLEWAAVSYHPRRQPIGTALLNAIRLDRAAAFYRARFQDMAGATVIIVGRFDPDSLRPLVERYLASLPARRITHRWRDRGIRFIRDTAWRYIYAGIEPKSYVNLRLFGTTVRPTLREEIAAQLLQYVLDRRIMEIVREEKGASYSPGASVRILRRPELQPIVNMFASCAPDSVQEVLKTFWSIADTLGTAPPDTARLAQGKVILLREHERALQADRQILGKLTEAYWYGDDPEQWLLAYPAVVRSVSASEVRDLARRYLSRSRWLACVLMPVSLPPQATGHGK